MAPKGATLQHGQDGTVCGVRYRLYDNGKSRRMRVHLPSGRQLVRVRAGESVEEAVRRTAGLPTASEPSAAMELPSAELPATATESCEPAAKRPCQDATSAAALDVETSDEAGAAGPAEDALASWTSGRANLGKIDRFVDSKLVTEDVSYWRQSLGSRHERTRAPGAHIVAIVSRFLGMAVSRRLSSETSIIALSLRRRII